jgi:hypothetical protein
MVVLADEPYLADSSTAALSRLIAEAEHDPFVAASRQGTQRMMRPGTLGWSRACGAAIIEAGFHHNQNIDAMVHKEIDLENAEAIAHGVVLDCTDKRQAAVTPYFMQGDLRVNTEEAIAHRLQLRHDHRVLAALEVWFQTATAFVSTAMWDGSKHAATHATKQKQGGSGSTALLTVKDARESAQIARAETVTMQAKARANRQRNGADKKRRMSSAPPQCVAWPLHVHGLTLTYLRTPSASRSRSESAQPLTVALTVRACARVCVCVCVCVCVGACTRSRTCACRATCTGASSSGGTARTPSPPPRRSGGTTRTAIPRSRRRCVLSYSPITSSPSLAWQACPISSLP